MISALLKKLSAQRNVIQTHMALILVAAVIAMYLFSFFPGSHGRIEPLNRLFLLGMLFLFAYFFVLFISGKLRPRKKH